MAVLTAQQEDFPRWYQDVLTKAKLAETGPARGTMVIRPNGYAIWERMADEVDRRIKAAGAANAYFPLLMPMSFFAMVCPFAATRRNVMIAQPMARSALTAPAPDMNTPQNAS